MTNSVNYQNSIQRDSARTNKQRIKKQPVLWLFLAVLAFSLPFTANAVQNPDFNHFTTGFPLSGQHIKVDCESCHVNGVFKGTPKVCGSCHNGRLATGKNSTHIASSNACDYCHTTFTWDKAAVDHSQVKGDCRSCHQLPIGHLPTTRQCNECHGTISWTHAFFDHSNIIAGCINCHSNDKKSGHVGTTADCGFCHGTHAWKGARFNHVTISQPCSSCHNGQTKNIGVLIPFKPPDHIDTTDECGACHSTQAWKPATGGTSATGASVVGATALAAPSNGTPSPNPPSASVDHNTVASGTCNRCHIGDKPPGHLATPRSCDACHNTHTWAGAKFDHNKSSGQCMSCHANDKPIGHLRTNAQCSECHNTQTWNSANFDHSNVTNNCMSCHNGSAARGKPRNHPLTGNQCETCHNSRAWTPVNFDHDSTTASCNNCHKKPRRHPRTSNRCDDCHNSNNWGNVRFDHGGVSRACDSCHNKPVHHPVTSRKCNDCHKTTRWQSVTYNHISANYPGDHRGGVTCVNCHGQTLDHANWRVPSYAPDCAGCHANAYRPEPHTKYGNVKYTVGELRDCAGPCHVYSDSSLSLIRRHRNGGQHRTRSGGFD